eukprot:4677121-Amphidinium_carterae.1
MRDDNALMVGGCAGDEYADQEGVTLGKRSGDGGPDSLQHDLNRARGSVIQRLSLPKWHWWSRMFV